MFPAISLHPILGVWDFTSLYCAVCGRMEGVVQATNMASDRASTCFKQDAGEFTSKDGDST